MAIIQTFIAQLALAALASGHGVILNAQGLDVDPAVARNCTTINPCQQDATIIRQAEIDANIVNQCGRTELSGNIDVGENTENALAAGAVTQVEAGSQLTVTIHQVNADGAGPYACDLDETSNTGTISQNLTVTNNVPGTNGFSQAKTQSFNITVQMPDSFTCTGASTGNVCTVRCRNNALAGPFGGCFAVQQADTDEKTNDANSIQTAQTLEGVLSQVQTNQADFKVSVDANKNAGSDEAAQNLAAVEAILSASIVSKAAAQETPVVENNGGNNQNNNGDNQNNNGGNQNNNGDDAAATTTAADAAATTPAAGDGTATTDLGAGNDIVTSVITPAAPAATTDAAAGDNTGDDTTDDTTGDDNTGNNGGNGNNNNGNNNNNGGNGNGNGRNNGFGGFGNGNFGRAASGGLRWAKRVATL
ncbi:hypothetical protein G7Z17_g7862 [Cylindrodendrum hubeiense]|uniref:GEgh 16 protein n=1 Tax=Cylindrodendrum hubeiense TaxID=595255 RepID=A0A9P5H314_9HYPO|nr:hypothetical protein G7Z17_g7862 [Cylindrodendrum hubeiense]